MTDIVYYALSFALIIPLGLLYYVPLRHYFRKPFYFVLLLDIGFYFLCCLLLPYLLSRAGGHNLLVMLPILIGFFVINHMMTGVDILISFFVFSWAAGLISFASSFSQAVYLGSQEDIFSVYYGVLRIVFSLLIFFFIFLFIKNWDERFLIDTNIPKSLWYLFIPIPFILFYQNVVLISYTPPMIRDSYEFSTYLLIIFGAYAMYILLSYVFYSTAVLHIDRAKLAEEKRFLELQKKQYNLLTQDVELTRKLIHDFKHTINTLKILATESGDCAISEYLSQMDDFESSTITMNYCKHIPINSILNHYAFRAKTEGVPLKLQVNIPETLPMEDHEICALLGNLMENAIDACVLIPPKDRSFSLSIVMKDSNLVIVSSNTFNGALRLSGSNFLSTKHQGYGIGIRSMKETVERYNGTMNVHHNKNEFFVDMMLSLV